MHIRLNLFHIINITFLRNDVKYDFMNDYSIGSTLYGKYSFT